MNNCSNLAYRRISPCRKARLPKCGIFQCRKPPETVFRSCFQPCCAPARLGGQALSRRLRFRRPCACRALALKAVCRCICRISGFSPNSTGALALPLTIGRAWGWRRLTILPATECLSSLSISSCCLTTSCIVASLLSRLAFNGFEDSSIRHPNVSRFFLTYSS